MLFVCHRMRLLLLCLAVSLLEAFRLSHPSQWPTCRSSIFVKFATPKPTWNGDKGSASYSDDWLMQFHNQAQNEKQLETNSLSIWNEQQAQEQAQILEWQESFQRNGVADFTPPMSFGLNCLMVGENINTSTETTASSQATKIAKLPWEEQPEADITSLEIVTEQMALEEGGDPSQRGDANIIRTRLVSDSSPAINAGADLVSHSPTADTNGSNLRVKTEKRAAVYDCIVDQGLLGAVLLTENNREIVHELLVEASLALREHGIYVLNTKKMTPETIELLENYSQEVGLEWEFELDGISDKSGQVSVARRFNTGEMPKVGRLSRFQP